MPTFVDVARKAGENRTFRGTLAADPEKVLADISLTADADTRKTELFVLTVQQITLSAARRGVVEIDIERWGVLALAVAVTTRFPVQ